MELKMIKGCDVELIHDIDFEKLEPGDKLFAQRVLKKHLTSKFFKNRRQNRFFRPKSWFKLL